MTVSRYIGNIIRAICGKESPKTASVPEADWKYYFPDRQLVLDSLGEFFSWMRGIGWGKNDYIPDQKDCDNFAIRGLVEMYDILLEKLKGEPAADGCQLYLRQFSFVRENGKRHRLFYVACSDGTKIFIENYPVLDEWHSEDGYIRFLTNKEIRSGFHI